MSLDAKKAAFILHNRSRFNAYTAETKHFTSQDPSLDRSAKNLRALRKRLLAMGPLSAPEKQILDLIPEHIILQTASPHLGELNRTDTPLKSASTRTVASDSMHNIRTPNYHGRRHYNYFVAGVGIHPNTRSLRGEDTAYIKLSHLSQKNPIFLRYFFMSPHLSDLEYSRQWGPVVLAETTFVINFNKASNSIQYTFSSKTNGEKSLVFHASELTFAGVHIAAAMSQLFILFFRLTDEKFQHHVYEAIEKDEENAVCILSDTVTAFMPGWMIAEVKATCDIPWEIIDAWSGDYSQVRTLFAKYIGDRQYYISQFPIDILRKTVDAKIDKCNQEAIKKIAIFSNEASEEEKNLFILTIIRQFVGRAQCDWLDVYPVLNSIAVAIINDSEYSEMVTHILDVLFNIEFESNRNTLIKIKLNPNERGDKECADLFWVACELKHDRVDVLQCLIKHGGEVERFGLQYLTVAAGQGNNECVKYLARFKLDMQCRIRVDENAEYLSNPLAIYVKNNNMEMLRYLLDNGFDSNFIPKSNKMALTALDGALFLDNREITLFLLERGASADKMVLWPLILGNEGVKEDVLSKECFPLIFPILPAAEDLEDYFIPEHSYVTTASVAIVTGVDKQGDPFVILGKRKEDFFKSTIKSNYTFPGGLRNVGEPFSACAIREASEELGLPDLKSCIKDITCIYTYEDKFKYVKFYHINVGNSLAEKPVYAQDDFLLARKVSFKNIRFSEEYEGIVELRNGQLFLSKSTALLLKNIISKGKIDAKNDLIKISLLIEYEETLGEELFIKKLKAGDFLTMQTFVLLGFRVTPFVVKEALVTLYGSSENYRRIEIVNADETIKFLMENLNLKYCQQTHFDFFERKNHEKPCVLTEIWKLLKPNDITVDILNCLIAYGFDGNKISNLNIYDKEKLMLELIKSPSKTAVIEKIFSLGYSVYNPYELYLSAIIDFENEYKEEVTDHSIAIKNNIKTVRDYYKIEIPKSLIDIFKYCRGYSKIALNRLKDLLFEHQFCVEKLPASKELDTAISTIISCSLDEYKYQPLVLNTILDAFIEIKLPISDLSTLKWKISWYAGPLRRDGIDVDRIEEKLSKLVSISTRGSLGPQFG